MRAARSVDACWRRTARPRQRRPLGRRCCVWDVVRSLRAKACDDAILSRHPVLRSRGRSQRTAAALAAKAASSTIPTVFINGGDPVRAGIVPSLNRPEGNVTGASFFGVDVWPKQLSLLHQLLPAARAVGLLVGLPAPVHARSSRFDRRVRGRSQCGGNRDACHHANPYHRGTHSVLHGTQPKGGLTRA